MKNTSEREILKVEVDGCLDINGKKCDFLLIDISAGIAYFIELKGCELDTAVRQLGNSISVISKPQNGYIKKQFSKKNAYAVLSRSPKDSAKIKGLQKTFMTKYKTELNIKSTVFELVL